MKRGLGTQLRHLIDLLDGAVAAEYRSEGLEYRPRFTPVMRALLLHDAVTVTQIASTAGITQPAATQTVNLMIREGLLCAEPNAEDNRLKMIRLTAHGRKLVPRLQACWEATNKAAKSLDADLPFPLSQLLELAIEALAEKPFGDRIQRAHRARTNNRARKSAMKDEARGR